MNPSRIVTITPMLILGYSTEMTLVQNKTAMLWQRFMPETSMIRDRKDHNLISAEVYPDLDFFVNLNVHRPFTKWAGCEVLQTNDQPDSLDTLNIQSGVYAVFSYEGKSSDAGIFYRDIFSKWLPASMYLLDDRPHFAVMGKQYQHDHPESQEDIYIPIRLKP